MANDLPFHCPRLKADFLSQDSCEMNQLRVKTLLEKGIKWLGPLQHCRECQGKELKVRIEMAKPFVITEVEANTFLKPEQLAQAQPVNQDKDPEIKYCKNHPDRPEHKRRGFCLECLQDRIVRNRYGNPGDRTAAAKAMPSKNAPAAGILGPKMRPLAPEAVQKAKLATARLAESYRQGIKEEQVDKIAPPKLAMKEIKVGFPAKHKDLLEWLHTEADRNERTLPAQIIYLLKKSREMKEVCPS